MKRTNTLPFWKTHAIPLISLIITTIMVVIQIITKKSWIKEYWELYIILSGIFGYILYSWSGSEKSQRKRRIYFTMVLVAILYIVPYLSTIHILKNGLWSTSVEFTTVLILLISAAGIYLLIISDANITELSIGDKKVSILKEECKEKIIVNQDIANLLIKKIAAENEILKNMHIYVSESIKQIGDRYYCFENEFQKILNKYYSLYRENNDIIVSVYDVNNIKELKKDFDLNKGEFYNINENIQHDEITIICKNNNYLLIKPYKYFEENEGSSIAIIVLQSSTTYLSEVEAAQINSILSVFINELVLMLNIEIFE